jgi:hypothetical protein
MEGVDQMDRDEVPDMSETELFQHIRDELGVPVTRRAVKHAVLKREIVPTQISGRNLFSRNDAVEWVRSRKGAERRITTRRCTRSHEPVGA